MPTTQYTDHHIAVEAPVDAVFEVVADVRRWPQFFGPTVHADYVTANDHEEEIHLWATANGEVRDWISRRRLDRRAGRIRFEQTTPAEPLLSMGGEWIITPDGSGGSLVRLLHDFQVAGDDADAIGWVHQAVDRNSTEELRAVGEIARTWSGLGELMFSFEDRLPIRATAASVYDFLWSAGEWPVRIPHVERLELAEPAAGVQLMEMVTRTGGGATHSTTSVRLGFPHDRILYKQTITPALMRAHTGSWLISPAPDGVVATAEHTVILEPGNIAAVLGAEATPADARRFVETALRTNSSTTLRLAREFTENAVEGAQA
jgi:aromatase